MCGEEDVWGGGVCGEEGCVGRRRGVCVLMDRLAIVCFTLCCIIHNIYIYIANLNFDLDSTSMDSSFSWSTQVWRRLWRRSYSAIAMSVT